MDLIKKYWQWPLALFIAFVLLSSLPFKFSGAAEPTHIFHVVGSWLGIGLLRDHGAIIIGVFELIAGVLILIPSLRLYGAILAAGIIFGAITFHLFSPLGIEVVFYTDAAGNWIDYRLAEAAGGPYGDFYALDAQEGASAALSEFTYYQGKDAVLFWLAVPTFIFSLILIAARRGELLALLGKEKSSAKAV